MSDLTLANRLKEIITATENEIIQEKHITLRTLRHSIAKHLMHNKVHIKSSVHSLVIHH
ncbi:MAG: site-specific recombinase XerD [Polaribacter sp.]